MKTPSYRYDFYRYEGPRISHWHVRIGKIITSPGCAFIYIYRHAQEAKNALTRVFWYALLHVTKIITGIQFIPYLRVGRGLRILHFGGIVINTDAVIGKNFNIAQGVLIGLNDGGKKPGAPIIGDNVYCGANSIVIGGIKIGNDVLIAPGAFVNFDVPDNSIVLGNPGKIIPQESSPTRKYIVYPVEDYEKNS